MSAGDKVTLVQYRTLRPVQAEEGATYGGTLGVNLFKSPGVLLKLSDFTSTAPVGNGIDTTDDVDEGRYNLYFTVERAQDAVGAALTNSANVTLTYDDDDNTITADLTDLDNSGEGTLQAVTIDAKGRVSGYRDATITGTAGRVTVANGTAAAGVPTIDLATVTDAGGGTLQRTAFDTYGRKTGTSAATTSDLTEGSNLYFTTTRVLATLLAGLSTATSAAITAADSVLSAFGKLQAQITALASSLTGYVPTSRTISTTAPLTGGGDLSANRTFAIPAATTSVNGYLTSTDWTAFNNKVPTAITITAGTGLSGGGDLSANRTLTLANTAVTPASYGDSTHVATFTVNAQGQLTAAGSVAITAGAVSSVFGRTGAVIAAANDYTFAQIGSKPTTLSGYGITDAEPTIAAGTTAQYWRGDKTWQALDKASVGLGNVDNTSDMSKPVSTAQAAAIATKEPAISAGTTAQFWRGDKTFSNTLVGTLTVDALVSQNSINFNTLIISTSLNLVATTGGPGGFVYFRPNGPSSTTGQFFVAYDGTTVFDGVVRSLSDNSHSLGDAVQRWGVVYAATGTINTSDAREKTDVAPLSADELASAADMARAIGTYQWLASVTEKGAGNARHHVGLTVQRAIEIMQSHNLDPMRYGFICYDQWDETPEVKDDAGLIKQSYRTAGDRYSFRMDELNLFIARGFDSRLSALEAKS